MATSGSYDWTLTRDQIITNALEDLGVLEEGESPSPEQISTCSRRLNGVVKQLKHEGIFLWAQEWVTQTLTTSSAVTSGGSTYRCIRGHTSSATDEPGTGANWTTYWVEDSSATSGGAWALSTAYTTIGEFSVAADTIGINKMFVRDGTDDDPITLITMNEYMDINNKTEEGTPERAVFYRDMAPRVILHYQPDSTDYVIHYERVRKLEDFDAGSNNFDGPEEWLPLISKLLAADLCGTYRVPLQERSYLRSEANAMLRMAKRDNFETTDGLFIKGAHE